MNTRVVLVSTLILAAAAVAAAHRPAASTGRLVVHEWGTFTTVSGSDGSSLEWRPLVSGNELPGFVYDLRHLNSGAGQRFTQGKGDISGSVRMETPVLYFYADQETTLDVRVGFPNGTITEWYPQARHLGEGIDWGKIAIVPNLTTNLPAESAGNHYYKARETDSALVRVCGQTKTEFEKFLFYRGVGNFALPLTARLTNDTLALTNPEGIGEVVIFDSRHGKLSYTIQSTAGKDLTLARPATGTKAQLLADLQTMLVAQGLYPKEARAMVETWRDSWFEDGLRVFYVLPRAMTDEVLPLAIDPAPSETVRVLVGRIEVITPELEADTLAHPAAHGRFAEPVLKQLLAHTTDAEQRPRIEALLKQLSAN